MLKMCLVMWQSELQYAYKCYVYEKNMQFKILNQATKEYTVEPLHGVHNWLSEEVSTIKEVHQNINHRSEVNKALYGDMLTLES